MFFVNLEKLCRLKKDPDEKMKNSEEKTLPETKQNKRINKY